MTAPSRTTGLHGVAAGIKGQLPVLLVFAFLLLTNRYFSVIEDANLISMTTSDVQSYQAIAEAAPQFPAVPLPHHHAQRFAVPFLVGLIADGIGIPVEWAMRTLVCLILLAAIRVTDSFAARLGYAPVMRLAISSLIFLNPYMARISLAAPFMVNDLGFAFGLMLAFSGLFLQSLHRMLLGSILAIACRQTAILFIFPMAVYFILASWHGMKGYKARFAAFGCGAIVVGGYFLTGMVASTFSEPSTNLNSLTGLFDWWANDFDLKLLLLEFGARGLATFCVTVAGLGLILAQVRRGKPGDIHVTSCAVAFLLIFSLIALQPIMGGPEAGNLPRLSVLGLWCLVFGAILLKAREAKVAMADPLPAGPLAVLLIVLAMGSLHHIYSWPGQLVFGTHRGWFFIMQLTLAGILIFSSLRSFTARRSVAVE